MALGLWVRHWWSVLTQVAESVNWGRGKRQSGAGVAWAGSRGS